MCAAFKRNTRDAVAAILFWSRRTLQAREYASEGRRPMLHTTIRNSQSHQAILACLRVKTRRIIVSAGTEWAVATAAAGRQALIRRQLWLGVLKKTVARRMTTFCPERTIQRLVWAEVTKQEFWRISRVVESHNTYNAEHQHHAKHEEDEEQEDTCLSGDGVSAKRLLATVMCSQLTVGRITKPVRRADLVGLLTRFDE
eukprot:5103208-Prymnesium_polylepis.1